MMGLVLGTYFLFYIPNILIGSILDRKNSSSPVEEILVKTGQIFWFNNSWINAAIYAWKSKQFQVSFRKLLHIKSQDSSSDIKLSATVSSNVS